MSSKLDSTRWRRLEERLERIEAKLSRIEAMAKNANQPPRRATERLGPDRIGSHEPRPTAGTSGSVKNSASGVPSKN